MTTKSPTKAVIDDLEPNGYELKFYDSEEYSHQYDCEGISVHPSADGVVHAINKEECYLIFYYVVPSFPNGKASNDEILKCFAEIRMPTSALMHLIESIGTQLLGPLDELESKVQSSVQNKSDGEPSMFN
jgi:hypothetical protein